MVALSSIFERLVLLEAEARCPPSKRGRPRELSDSEALSVFFKVLRTGMQWREADGDVHYTTLLRRMHVWSKNHVFDVQALLCDFHSREYDVEDLPTL